MWPGSSAATGPAIGSCWRKLNPGRQALLVLVHLRKGETFAGLAAGFSVGTATAWRYARETIRLLAASALKLRGAGHRARTGRRLAGGAGGQGLHLRR